MVISIRKYALLKGCSEGNVRAAIRAGKIKQALIYNDGKFKGLDVAIADKEWAENYNTDRIRNTTVFESFQTNDNSDVKDKKILKRSKGKGGTVKSKNFHKQDDKPSTDDTSLNEYETVNEVNLPQEFSDGEDENGITIAEAKRRESVLKGKLLQLELLERNGKVIPVDTVKKALFEYGSEVRSAILTVPDKVIDDVLASETRNEAYLLLVKSLNEALNTLTEAKILN